MAGRKQMDFLYLYFPVSGVKTWAFVPPLVAFFISFFTAMSGVSGAFLILPFQMSWLHFITPSVSATNFVYNIVAIPSGVYQYFKEGRMAWPLTWIVILGTLPGVFIGYYLRVLYLPDPRSFKLFVGCVLGYLGVRLLYEMREFPWQSNRKRQSLNDTFGQSTATPNNLPTFPLTASLPPEAVVRTVSVSLIRVEYAFWGDRFSFSTPGMFALALLVGIVGGIYGIGGGAIIAPFCVTVFRLPVYTIAGAALLGTFVTSIAGVCFYSLLPTKAGLSFAPDWALGFLFGAGGFVGLYWGARLQKFIPQHYLKMMLALLVLLLAASYIIQYFTR